MSLHCFSFLVINRFFFLNDTVMLQSKAVAEMQARVPDS